MSSSASPTLTPVEFLAVENIVRGIIAGVSGRGHRCRGKARAFLIGPVDDADRRLGLDPGVVQRAHHLERSQRAEHAVELAPGRLGVEMRAQTHRRFRHVAALAETRTSSRARRHALAGLRPRTRCETSRAPACPQVRASAAARRPLAWRRILRFHGWCPRDLCGVDLQIGGDFGQRPGLLFRFFV